ncbi:MAG: DUF1566 domain-containing protein [Candidatus Omnitrophica bacterium]|nr:DUF1566 domain-containing protein [Candidatus Omnitrophota bacterium]
MSKSPEIFKLPDTGDIRCYDREGREIPVPQQQDELYGQNGCFAVNPMSFTKLGKGGKVIADTSSWKDGYRMTRDNNTGLVWEVKSPFDKDINYCEGRYTWKEAEDKYIKDLNKKKYGGFSDWRLPNKDELRSIIDYNKTNPAVDTWYFPNCKSDFYWTSMPYAMQKPFIWGIFFGLGSGICYSPASRRYARAVRGGYAVKTFGKPDSARFTDNRDGTVTDTLAGLMWQQDENERMDWYSALRACKELRAGGYTDWRLPNLKELNSILNLDYTNGWWYYKDFFPAKGLQPPLLHYFSSTPYEGIYVWVTNFCFGYDGYYASKNAKLLFRAVRNVNRAAAQERKVFQCPDSGMKNCYDHDGNFIAVPKKGRRFYGQDGSYAINPLSFTKLRDGGKELDDKASWEKGLRMVRDNNTGLIWEIKSFDPADINFKEKKYTWEDTVEFISRLNKSNFGGFSDWRLPHREELRTIVDYEGKIPAIDEKFFPDILPEFYWSADVNIKEPLFAWGVYFAYGCTICYLRISSYPVRAVRGGYSGNFGNPGTGVFQDNGNGTVTDLDTGLMWKKDESPALSWEEAMKYCEDMTLGGYDDWRVPTVRELGALIDLSYKDGCWFYKQFFPGTQTAPLGFYWAATTYGDTFAWGCNFQFGYDGYYAGKKEGKYPFRPVRNTRSKIKNPV